MARARQTQRTDESRAVDDQGERVEKGEQGEEHREETRERFIDETGRAPTPAEEIVVETAAATDAVMAVDSRALDPDHLDVGDVPADDAGVAVDITRADDMADDGIDAANEAGTEVEAGAGEATAADAPLIETTTAGDLDTDGLHGAGGLGAEFEVDSGLADGRERDLGSTGGDFSSGPGEIDTGRGADLDGGLEGANAHDYPPNLRANLKVYDADAKSGNVERAYEHATEDLKHFNTTGLDVEPADPADFADTGGLLSGGGGNPTGEQLTKVMDELDDLGQPADSSPEAPPTSQPDSQPIDQSEPLRPGMADPSDGWGDNPNDPFDHDGGYTDPTDDVGATAGGIPPTEAPTDMVANYEEGYLPPADLSGDELAPDGYLDPVINPE